MDDAIVNNQPRGAIEIEDPAQFDELVIQRSHTLPVLVDFWANWCGPCHMLAPILDKVVAGFSGALSLVKVETDRHQELATRFQIRSLPTVMLFKDGQPVEQLLGVQPEQVLKNLLSRYVVTEIDKLVELAAAERAAGEPGEALKHLHSALEKDPHSDTARLQLAQLLLEQGEAEQAQEVLRGASIDVRGTHEYKSVAAAIELAAGVNKSDAPRDPGALSDAIAEHPDDLALRYQLALVLVQRQDYIPAMDQLLEIIKRDRDYDDGSARAAMLNIFELLGGKGETVSRYRGLLARVLN